MALSVIKRPRGFINSTTGVTGTYTNGSSVITKTGHGLITGATIFISDNQASGFWYVTPLTVDTFNIREYATATVYTFIGTGNFTYYASVDVAGHPWNALHLPIVYKLASTLWPTNAVDTSRTVSSYANDLGYVKLTLSGDIKSDVTELEFVKVTFTGGTTAIYQILTWYSNSIVTINLPYIGGITFVSVQYYYQDYHARIRIYGGLVSTHFFGSQKPYELITEIKAIPDSSGIVTVNINEYLKQKVDILRNDLLKGTLQNNLDAFCQFYIEYAEAYSYSAGGYTLLDYIGSYTTDSVTGYAVNADLPFKNLHSGYMSDYVYGSSATKLKFLTPSVEPVLFGNFFDISFINQIGARLRMKIERYQNGQIINSIGGLVFEDLNDYGVGVYRYPVTQSAYLEDRIDLTLQWNDYTGFVSISETKTIMVDTGCAFAYLDFAWLNSLGGFDYWRFKDLSEYGADIRDTTEAVKNIYPTWPRSFGQDADTIRFETSRVSNQTINVRADNLTDQQVIDLKNIKLSPLVQIVNSRTDRRTVILDKSSFMFLKKGDKNHTLSFTCAYTDDFPSQSQ